RGVGDARRELARGGIHRHEAGVLDIGVLDCVSLRLYVSSLAADEPQHCLLVSEQAIEKRNAHVVFSLCQADDGEFAGASGSVPNGAGNLHCRVGAAVLEITVGRTDEYGVACRAAGCADHPYIDTTTNGGNASRLADTEGVNCAASDLATGNS